MTRINITLLLITTLAALTGFAWDKVEKPKDGVPLKPLVKRIMPAGWVFLVLTLVACGVSVYKETVSFEGRVRAVYPEFASIVKLETSHSQEEWTKYMSYRVSLRFLVQSLYRKMFDEPKESMEVMLKGLGQKGAIPDELCKKLDFIRYHTYKVEWGIGKGGSVKDLEKVSRDAPSALNDLATLVHRTQTSALSPNVQSVCGEEPRSSDNETH